METFIFGLKVILSGVAIIAVIFVICFFLVQKFYRGHAHGMPGILTGIVGASTTVIFAITAIILIWRGEQNFLFMLKIAGGLGLGFGSAITLLELSAR